MVIVRYLIKETLKSQLGILFILLLVFFCQKMIRILSATVDGDIPSNLVFSLLILGLAEMGQVILPLSLFLAILITFSRLYIDSEMTAMFACRIKYTLLLRAVFYLSLITATSALINNFWLAPKSVTFQEYLVANAKINPSVAGIIGGQFQQSKDTQSVLYIEDVKQNQIKNIFVAKLTPINQQIRPSIIIANSGHFMQNNRGDQIIVLDDAISYEGTVQDRDFRITEFKDYQAVMKYKTVNTGDLSNDISRYSIVELIKSSDDHKARTELNWRLTLIVAVPLLAFMVLPLSASNPRQNRMMSILPALIIFLIYYLLASSVRSAGLKNELESTYWLWLINFCFLIVIILLNIWDSVPIRCLRDKLRRQH